MELIRCLLVDDEPLALEVLKKFVSSTPGLVLSGAYTKPLEAFLHLQHEPVDLLFIDIQMPGLTGLELIRALKNPPQVIFTTAYREYAVEGFELNVLDYLVKPIARDRFLKTIDRYNALTTGNATQKDEQAEPSFIFVKVDKAMMKIYLNDILYVESLKNYVRIKTTGKEAITYHTLSYMEEKLPARLFQRIHKSFLVNLDKIDHYNSETIGLAGKELPIGKTYQDVVMQRLAERAI